MRNIDIKLSYPPIGLTFLYQYFIIRIKQNIDMSSERIKVSNTDKEHYGDWLHRNDYDTTLPYINRLT
jgi:hypothetical protein